MQIDTKIIAHRGSRGTRPENTLVSFQTAIDEGAEGIETDVHFSKDKQFIIMHDETVDRTTNGTGLIMDKTLGEIKKLDAGIRFSEEFKGTQVPTLQEVVNMLMKINFTGIFNLELKTNKIHYPGLERAVYEYFAGLRYPFQLIYSSFNGKSLEILNKIDPKAYEARLFKTAAKQAKTLKRSKVVEDFHPDIKWIKQHPFYAPARHLRPWVVNSTEDMQYCFERNMAAVITDYPGRAVQLRSEMRGGLI
ncbi:glycerophosphodiester phosphodiesterase family protein [Lentilactobacillus hilgardii]|uniref:glycerophosphodiester phosphodiesterase family protein n=1 Tax=Lentilactobacillus hilgardii TaxID=1588 RepID=UPI0021C2C1FA|nr:glycerophosphodiester phosphodiesterase family protein [Lentilactobacillus hilgardii]MCP9332105.1 glycerophosphodiester phosphodiesterase [Lentilactobacillus hilgardii]MCP9348672.1 glycerophosphodiester phosphodiesterase [Lentilactobacillus hilgardii]MCP9351500.1 glycerophosphodiester phosphodiesterase [Lentilactobacillus hilgardii]